MVVFTAVVQIALIVWIVLLGIGCAFLWVTHRGDQGG